MAKRNPDCGNVLGGRIRANKPTSPATKIYHSSPSPSKGDIVTQRLSQARLHSPPNIQSSSPRTSPGIACGRYAGCKWTEPPSPSALPLPPQHWMQTSHSVVLPFHTSSTKHDIAQQLKMLLKVHA